MTGLAEQELHRSPARVWAGRAGLALLVLGLIALVVWMLSGLGGSKGPPKRQVAKIAILPDTPPPPPPPPKEDKPPPKDEPKQAAPTEAPKPDTPPEPAESLKMEGPAGTGPSAFGAGNISREYQGGDVLSGGRTGAGAGDRAKFMFYVNSARQTLRTELDKHLAPGVLALGARLQIWISPSGAIQRYEIAQIGDRDAEPALRAALDKATRAYHLPAPAGMPQPLELQLSVKPAGS